MYNRVIKDMHEGARMSISTPRGVTNDFYVGRCMHRCSTLSLFLFPLVTNKLTKGIQDELSWYILFIDDIVLIDEIRKVVNNKLER